MTARAYVPGDYVSNDEVVLPEEEGRHLTRVLRLRAGGTLRVFNGRGQEFGAQITLSAKSEVRVRIGAPVSPAPEPRIAVTLVQAVLKGDKMDGVVRDAVMLGAVAVQPIVTARTEIAVPALVRGRRQDRWQRVAIASSKQCGRAVVPVVAEPQAWETWLASQPGAVRSEPRLLFVEPGASDRAGALHAWDGPVPHAATMVVGPEGGWTAEEVTAAEASCRLVTLGGRTLRADAMAVVGLAALFALWREF